MTRPSLSKGDKCYLQQVAAYMRENHLDPKDQCHILHAMHCVNERNAQLAEHALTVADQLTRSVWRLLRTSSSQT